ncbi:uncharacterized protein [Drosophila pseudoobscura]|uniref:Uncharacterized protein isoform X2 n=1 Tax=Drosophila pseudoobscura pseudoobscura TaxID=46245 RepID=A0A6I8WA06_DROPS|nr:uncharacterized protein LOC117184985 isoform X2 [Drosophila pseudoobscura]
MYRAKWRTSAQIICKNDLVLVKDENILPMLWPLAGVVDVVMGKDGVCRVSDLKTSLGNIRMAVTRLCLLPLKESVERLPPNEGK